VFLLKSRLEVFCMLKNQLQQYSMTIVEHSIKSQNSETICDQVFEKGSYSLSELSLIHHNSSCFQHISFIFHSTIMPCMKDKWTKYKGDNIFTSQVTGCQIHVNEKAPSHRQGYSLCSTITYLQVFWTHHICNLLCPVCSRAHYFWSKIHPVYNWICRFCNWLCHLWQ